MTMGTLIMVMDVNLVAIYRMDGDVMEEPHSHRTHALYGVEMGLEKALRVVMMEILEYLMGVMRTVMWNKVGPVLVKPQMCVQRIVMMGSEQSTKSAMMEVWLLRDVVQHARLNQDTDAQEGQ